MSRAVESTSSGRRPAAARSARASRASRTATARRRTTCRARPRPGAAPRRTHRSARGRCRDVRLAGVAVVDRQPVAPPQLARDAPGADVLHPVQVHAAVVLGHDPHAAVAHGVDRGRGELVHAHEPLQRDQRLDALARSGASRARCGGRARSRRSALPRQRRHDRLARLHHRQPGEALAASAVMRPSSPITDTWSSSWRRPISKSLGSCAGVTFSWPVPKSLLTYSSAITGRWRPTSGRIAVRARPGRGSARRAG